MTHATKHRAATPGVKLTCPLCRRKHAEMVWHPIYPRGRQYAMAYVFGYMASHVIGRHVLRRRR